MTAVIFGKKGVMALGAGIKLFLRRGPVMTLFPVFMADPEKCDDGNPENREGGKNLFRINVDHLFSSLLFHSTLTTPVTFSFDAAGRYNARTAIRSS